jgi:LysR family glycine cleavage system transcriptional activator
MLAACVRHASFTRAAAELCLTPSAVSARIRSLEAELGVTLFERQGPKLTATEHAMRLAATVDDALGSIRSAVDSCRRVKRPVRVTCAPTFARWLLPRLASYHALADAEAIALDATPTLLPDDRFDIAIRSGNGGWSGVSATHLLADHGTPMLSPKLLHAGRPLSPRGLLDLPLIHDARWARWFDAAGVLGPEPSFARTRFATYELEAAAAVQGMGVALLSPVLYEDLLLSGALVAPFKRTVEGPASYWVLWREDAPTPHFVPWVQEALARRSPPARRRPSRRS